MSRSKDPDPGSDEVTIGQLEDRSNRNSWRIMYVFMGVLAIICVILVMAVLSS